MKILRSFSKSEDAHLLATLLRDNGVEELSDVAGMTEALKNRASLKSDS